MALSERNLMRLRRILRQAVRQLPQPYRAIGELYLCDYRLTQIARILGIPWSSFYPHTWQTFLHHLRNTLHPTLHATRHPPCMPKSIS